MSKIISNVLKVHDLLLKARADFSRNKFEDGLNKISEALDLMTDIREQLIDLSRTASSVKAKVLAHGLIKFMDAVITKGTHFYQDVSYYYTIGENVEKLRRRVIPKLDAIIYVWNKSVMKYAPKV